MGVIFYFLCQSLVHHYQTSQCIDKRDKRLTLHELMSVWSSFSTNIISNASKDINPFSISGLTAWIHFEWSPDIEFWVQKLFRNIYLLTPVQIFDRMTQRVHLTRVPCNSNELSKAIFNGSFCGKKQPSTHSLCIMHVTDMLLNLKLSLFYPNFGHAGKDLN